MLEMLHPPEEVAGLYQYDADAAPEYKLRNCCCAIPLRADARGAAAPSPSGAAPMRAGGGAPVGREAASEGESPFRRAFENSRTVSSPLGTLGWRGAPSTRSAPGGGGATDDAGLRRSNDKSAARRAPTSAPAAQRKTKKTRRGERIPMVHTA